MPQIATVGLVSGLPDNGVNGTPQEAAVFRHKLIAWRVLRHEVHLYFQSISGTRDQEIERRHEEDADQEPREQAADDDERKRPLGVGAHAGGQGGHERGHHDRAQPQNRALARSLLDARAAAPQFVHV